MGLHKLLAGDGYTYLTRQVAANDATATGYKNLGDYYSDRGETPGRWLGSGLSGLDGLTPGAAVTEAQMVALFGHGRHPCADQIARDVMASGGSFKDADLGGNLGTPFPATPEANEFRRAMAKGLVALNRSRGLPSQAPISHSERAELRTRLATDRYTAEFGRPPADERELTDYITHVSRPSPKAVAGYDLTFSPVKSVSTLWAVADRDVAAQIEAAHHAAVADTMRWLEDNAAYTRQGRNGVRQVDTTGLIAAAFLHRDSRAGDPDLHTHVAISNKVQTLDGHWLALDGRVLHKAVVSASERYNTRLEAHLSQRLGVRFAERPDRRRGDKRPVREIVGVDQNVNDAFSTRRAAITKAAQQLAGEFREHHGRHPDASEASRLFQQANLDTRQRKHAPRSEAEQRDVWHRQAVALLRGERYLAWMLDRAIPTRDDTAIPPGDTPAARSVSPGQHAVSPNLKPVTPHLDLVNPDQDAVNPDQKPVTPAESVRSIAEDVIATVAERYATWQVHHVRAETERRIRTIGADIATVDDLVDRVVAAALSPDVSVRLGPHDVGNEPAALRRRDGSSVFTVAGAQLYTCAAVLGAEQRVVDAALRDDGRTVNDGAIDVAVLGASANGVALTEEQQRLVHDLATSGARVQLALAPAGSGKTTALGVLARAWSDSGGSVVGLAPSAVAAAELHDSLGVPTDTVAKLLHSLSESFPPEWVRGIDAATLLIVDEAGMVGTLDLDRVIALAMERGASVRLVGDDRQLSSIKTGGVLRDIAEVAGAVRMESLVRFADPVEGLASLALRDGDPGALGYYLSHGRVHSGDAGSALDQAYDAWRADRGAGLDSIMLAATRDQVQQLNLRARADRLSDADRGAPTVRLHDGTDASAGDVIITRRNDRRLPLTASDWVKNGDRFRVTAVGSNGDLQVTHLDTRRGITLPARYVGDHVELGYASTVHTAQGRTADTSHVVITGQETRDTLYVAMTRGRLANHVYVAAGSSGDPHLAATPDAVIPPTSVEMLERVIAHDGIRRSASTHLREISSPSPRLAMAVARYEEAFSRSGLLSGDRPGPLPWLPAPPQRPAGDEWGDYLSARADLVRDVAKEVAAAGPDSTTWSLWLAKTDAHLSEQVSVWRAARSVSPTDDRVTGELGDDAIGYQHDLDRRVTALLGEPDSPASRWTELADAIDPRLTAHPGWLDLGLDLTRAANAGYDVPANLPRLVGSEMSSWYGIHGVKFDLYKECPAAKPPAVHRPVEPAPSDNAARARRENDNGLLPASHARAANSVRRDEDDERLRARQARRNEDDERLRASRARDTINRRGPAR